VPDDEHRPTEPTDADQTPDANEKTDAGMPEPPQKTDRETPDPPAPSAPALVEEDVVKIVSRVLRRLAPAFTGVSVLVLFVQLLIEQASPSTKLWLTVAAIGIAGGSWAWDFFRSNEARRRPVIAAIVGVSLFCLVVGYLLRPIVVDLYNDLFVDCDDQVELSVLLPVDGAAGFRDAIAEFNREYTESNGCRRANVTAYSAPWPNVQDAMAAGWRLPEEEPEGALEPLRDVGPRPDFWIAESQTQVELAAEALHDSGINNETFAPEDAEPIGRTPLVLAVPDALLDAGFNDGEKTTAQALPDLITQLGDEYGTPVLRSDPAVTHSGLLFLRALYGPGAEPGGAGARLENRLADAAAATGIALSPSDTGLLCDLSRTGPNPTAAVLTTEAALSRYNTGGSLGPACALTDSPRSGLAPIYSEAFGSLDYQGITLDWNDDPWAGKRAAVAEDLRQWLAGEDRRWNPTQMGVRDLRYEGGELAGDVDFDKDFPVEADPISAGEFEAQQAVYDQNRVPTDVLLAIDHSATMDEPGGGGKSRFELATAGVAAALDYLGADDRVGIWTFPADGSASHEVVLDIGPDPGNAVDLLADTQVSQGVDLHQTILDGVAELEAARGDEGVSAMVVLTDGADIDTTTAAETVKTRLADSQVDLYLIAVGEASCRSASFAALTEDTRVTCLEAEAEQITVTFDSLFDQLWSGNG
jgi:hypothetical protein